MEQRIKAKIEAVGVPLKDWDINIYRGILTGFNEAFIIDGNKRNEILANCKTDEERQKTDELIRPLLRGRDIKRYSYDFADLYLICTFPSKSYNIDEFPAVKKFLEGFKSKLEQTGKKLTKSEIYNITEYAKSQGIEIKEKSLEKSRKKTNNKWFETQDSISYWEEFSKQKIAWASVGETLYSLIPKDTFLLDTNYFFTIEEEQKFLLAILNTKLITYWINSEDTPIGNGGAYRHYKYNLEKLPIIQPTKETEQKLSKLLETNNYDEIDKLIYQLYNLTNEEIELIEKSIK